MQNAPHIFQVVRARTAPATRLLLALGSGLVIACAMLASAAHAQEAPQPRSDRQQQREAPRDMQRQEMQRQEYLRQEMLRQEMIREQRAYEEQQRRNQAQQEQQQDGHRRNGRMTADERSELRRQINEANQDIYARPRERR